VPPKFLYSINTNTNEKQSHKEHISKINVLQTRVNLSFFLNWLNHRKECQYNWPYQLLEKLRVTQIAKKLSALYGTWRSIAVITRAPLIPILRLMNPVHTFHLISLRSMLILSFHLCCLFSTCPIPFMFADQNFVCIPHRSHACYILCPSHPPWLHHPNNIWWHKLWNSSLCNIFQPPTTSSLLSPNILLSILSSDTSNLCSSLSVKEQVSHPYKTRGKIRVLYK